MGAIRAGIITALSSKAVSDSAWLNASADQSGPTIRELIEEHEYECTRTVIVPDNEDRIRDVVKLWCDQNLVDWIITTGGTGFGVRDITPEAISPLLEREASGIVHLLLSASLKHTPLAALSRPVAGTLKSTLIVTLPGSVKAVKENMAALFSNGLVDHAIDLIRGGSGKQVHAAMGSSHPHVSQNEGGSAHHHDHHHHGHGHKAPQARAILSHDPSLPASNRHRVSPYPLISLEQALGTILKETEPLKSINHAVTPTLAGHVLAEDVYAPQNVPPSKSTSVDGYALRSADQPGVYKVLTSQNHALADILPEGFIFRINTGSPLPAGADTVIMVEDTELVSTTEGLNGEDIDEREVKTLVQVPAGENVRDPGSDVHLGDLVLQRNEVITSLGGEIGTLAFVGRKEVYRKPIIAILSTGNEIVDLQSPQSLASDGWGGIWDTNRPSLQAALNGMGYSVVDLGVVPDDLEAHVQAIQKGLQSADILLTTGGTSMGASDLLKPVIERKFGGTVHFGRVAMKPGKPTTFASIPTPEADHGRKFMFALPGNPASALVTFYVFVIPALRKLGGWPVEKCQLPRIRVQLGNAMRLDPRTEFHRVIVRTSDNGLRAITTGGQRSSRVASLSGANGLVVLPARTENGPEKLEVGEYAEAVIIGELEM
ncbi:MoaB/Mog domain-containing protein [Hygrophoropsis aurantiaca]|uniref:MoaB/Mog domain-containing protein n=1 Tax=Hygrophoropsis aurantiaca TaxID=72124 RepID=A0ACB8AI61_9AGAM|nr:MoaB/Mog domain-containing protein [Hygrophoropsis aurantiaca]